MNANDVIESYVHDVAVQLPRAQRNDVAFELRDLLHEELQAKADAAGRDADAAMAIELARAFGRPADVAARYRPALTIIDPADGRAFLRAAGIGLAIIWSLGLWEQLRTPVDSAGNLLLALGRWWGGTVIPSLWWPGLLVTSFGLAEWARRRWPHASEWKPRAGGSAAGNRAVMVLGLAGILCGAFVLLDPRGLLEALFGSRLAPAAYEALTYTDTFRHRQAPWLLVLILLNVPMMISGIVSGRWPATLWHARLWLSLVTCAVMTWTVLDGPVLVVSVSDQAARGSMALIVVLSLLGLGLSLYRGVRPAPDTRFRA